MRANRMKPSTHCVLEDRPWSTSRKYRLRYITKVMLPAAGQACALFNSRCATHILSTCSCLQLTEAPSWATAGHMLYHRIHKICMLSHSVILVRSVNECVMPPQYRSMILNMLIRCCHVLPTACHEARACHPDGTMPIVIQHKAKVATSYTLHISAAICDSKGWNIHLWTRTPCCQ